jgi:hypothetical protein
VSGVTNNSSRTARLQADVSRSSKILEEIYTWFVANLKNSVGDRLRSEEIGVGKDPQLSDVNFELQADGLSCRRATFSTTHFGDHESSLFQCICSCGSNISLVHKDQVLALKREYYRSVSRLSSTNGGAVVPSSYPVRLSVNPQSWIIYNTRNTITNVLETVRIKAIPLKCNQRLTCTFGSVGTDKFIVDLSLFEEQFIRKLDVWSVANLLRRGKSTLIAHIPQDGRNIRMLNVVGSA